MMLSKEKQIRNGLIYFIPIIVSNLLPLITLPFFTRVLSIEDYGVLALTQVYSIFVTGIANMGLIIGYERNFFQYNDPRTKSQLLYSVLLFVCIGLIVLGCITFFIKDLLSVWIIGVEGHGNLFMLSFCASSTVVLKPYFLTYFKNVEDAKSNSKYSVIDSTLNYSIAVVLILHFDIGVSGILWGQLLSGILILAILTIQFLKQNRLSFSASILKECLLVSYPLTPRIFLKIVATQFDKYLIGLINSIGGVGIYNIGQKISTLVFTFMTTLENVFSPQVYKRMFELKEDGGKSIGSYLTPFIFISIAAAMAVVLFSEEMVKILTPSSYHEAVNIIIILSLNYGVMFFGKQPQLIYAKKTGYSTMLFMLYLILNIALNIPFIKMWGIQGAAWATFLSGVIYISTSFFVAQYFYRIEWEYSKILKIYALFFISAVSMILFQHFSMNYYLSFTVKMIFLTLYILLGINLKIITTDNFLLIRRILLKST